MTLDESVRQFAEAMTARKVILDGAVLMPPQDPPTGDPLHSSERWRAILQDSFTDHMTGHNLLHDGRFTRAY